MSGALARPAMQLRVASLARTHASSTRASALHGDQMDIDPSVTAGSASCDAQTSHDILDERRQVFASTASMAVPTHRSGIKLLQLDFHLLSASH